MKKMIIGDIVMLDSRDKVKPNFLIIGAAKAGTTSFYQWLRQHPEVFMPAIKEPSFFVYGYGISDFEKYLSFFETASSMRAIGEASTAYLVAPEAPQLIYKMAHDIKIIVLLRNPVHRAVSLYAWMVREGYEWLNTFERALAEEERRFHDPSFRWNNPEYFWDYMYFRSGLYYEQVKRYIDTFGEESVKIYLFEELVNRPTEVYRDVCYFLDITPKFVPNFIAYNQAKNKPEISLAVAEMLQEMYRKDIIKLAELIQRDLFQS